MRDSSKAFPRYFIGDCNLSALWTDQLADVGTDQIGYFSISPRKGAFRAQARLELL